MNTQLSLSFDKKLMKRCSRCKQILSLDCFFKNKLHRNGLYYHCKECVKRYRQDHKEKLLKQKKQYYYDNKERLNKKNMQYYQNNKEKIAIQCKKYRQENKEKIAKRVKRYRQDHKEEIAKRQKQYDQNHKEERANYQKRYRQNHKKKSIEYQKQYYLENKKGLNKRNAQYYQNHKKEFAEKYKQYYQENKDEKLKYAKHYQQNHKEKIIKYRQDHRKEKNERGNQKYKEDPKHRLNMNIGALIRRSLKTRNISKNRRPWESLVNFTLEELMTRLEGLFQDGMTWKNRGKWHVDHIKPISLFDFESVEDPGFKECWSLNNLQPLWAKENLEKSNKYHEW